MNLSWTDNASNETWFDVMRARWVAGVWTEWTNIAAPTTNTTTATDTAVPDGFYAYLVRASNTAGSSDWAITVIEHTTVTTPPAAPSNLVLTNLASGVQLDWSDNSTSEHRFDIGRARYNPTTATWGEWTFFVADRTTTTYTDTTASDGQYAYLVRAINPNGPSDWAITVTTHTTTTATSNPPTGLIATASDGGYQLTWTDTATNEVFYELQRARWNGNAYVDWTTRVLDKNTVSYLDTPVGAGTYAYLLRTTNPNGASTWTITTT